MTAGQRLDWINVLALGLGEEQRDDAGAVPARRAGPKRPAVRALKAPMLPAADGRRSKSRLFRTGALRRLEAVFELKGLGHDGASRPAFPDLVASRRQGIPAARADPQDGRAPHLRSRILQGSSPIAVSQHIAHGLRGQKQESTVSSLAPARPSRPNHAVDWSLASEISDAARQTCPLRLSTCPSRNLRRSRSGPPGGRGRRNQL